MFKRVCPAFSSFLSIQRENKSPTQIKQTRTRTTIKDQRHLSRRRRGLVLVGRLGLCRCVGFDTAAGATSQEGSSRPASGRLLTCSLLIFLLLHSTASLLSGETRWDWRERGFGEESRITSSHPGPASDELRLILNVQLFFSMTISVR